MSAPTDVVEGRLHVASYLWQRISMRAERGRLVKYLPRWLLAIIDNMTSSPRVWVYVHVGGRGKTGEARSTSISWEAHSRRVFLPHVTFSHTTAFSVQLLNYVWNQLQKTFDKFSHCLVLACNMNTDHGPTAKYSNIDA